MASIKVKDAKIGLTDRTGTAMFMATMTLYNEEDNYEYELSFNMEKKKEVKKLKKLLWYAGKTEVEELNGLSLGNVEVKRAVVLPPKMEEFCEITEPLLILFDSWQLQYIKKTRTVK